MQIRKKRKYQELSKSENEDITFPEIIRKNLKKYNVSNNRYNRYMINHLLYQRRKTIVSKFKDHLIMNDMGEFLKRFYKMNESINRLPRICDYYEQYTLFAPVYFAFEFSLTKILRKFCKRKKKYLEYIEDLEDNIIDIKDNKNKNEKFELIIKPELVENCISKDKSIQTLDLTQYNNNNNNENNKKDLSNLLNDLSSTIEGMKNKKDMLKEKIATLKKTKRVLENKFHLNLTKQKQKKRPSLLLKEKEKKKSILLTKEQSIKSVNQIKNRSQSNDKTISNEKKKYPIKIKKKIIGLKLNFNNLYKGINNIPFSTISLTDRFIPTKSDDLIKEKLGWLKKKKIKIKTSQFIDSIINKNYANTSRNKNRAHLVIKQISSQQYSSRTNSNESKLFKTTEQIHKKKMKIKLDINEFNKSNNKKSRNSNSIIRINHYRKNHWTETNSRYPSVVKTQNSSDKYYNITDKNINNKKKSVLKKQKIKIKDMTYFKIQNIRNIKKNKSKK